MIKCENERVIIAGSGVELMQDFVNITKGFRQVLVDKCGEERADEIIGLLGRFAYADNDDDEEMYATRLCEVMFGKDEESVRS